MDKNQSKQPVNNRKNTLPNEHEHECISCKKPASILQEASGRYLCDDCYCRYVERSIRKTITKYKLIQNDDVIAVGVSGGKDSLTMLYNLYERQKRIRNAPKLIAIYVDEGIRNYRSESELNLMDFFDRYGIDVEYKKVSFQEHFGIPLYEMVDRMDDLDFYYNSCTMCGVIRRRLLNDTAIEMGANKLAIGHNLDDIAQTVILNVIRNDVEHIWQNPPYMSTKDNGSGLGEHFIPRIKPLIHLTEKEIILYSKLKGFKFQSCNCPHSHTFPIFRKSVQIFLNKFDKRNREVKYNLLKVHETLYEKMAHLNDTNMAKTDTEIINGKNNDSDAEDYKGTKDKRGTKDKKGAGIKLGKVNKCPRCGYPMGSNRQICLYCYFKEKYGID